MTEKQFKLKICSNGNYYLYKNNDLVIPYVDFDKFNKENANKLLNALNNLLEENEQLKSVIKEVTELLSDEVDLFSEKATEHDIIAYVELKELDNKDAFYMATATKKAIRMLKELKSE